MKFQFLVSSFQFQRSVNASSGFTLIELVVSIAILSIMSVITIDYIISASQLYDSVSSQNEADCEALAALNRMRREIRLLRTTVVADVNTLSFTNQADVTKIFQLNGTDLTLNGYILAADVDRFILTYYDETNGLLSPLPLPPGGTNIALIRRVALGFKVTKGSQSSDLDVNIFYPRYGILK